MLDEDEAYLQNFWKPAPGQTVTHDKGRAVLKSVDRTHPEQAELEGTGEIIFLQDHSWLPALEEMPRVLEDLGCIVCGNIARVGRRTWKPLPERVGDYARLIREVRMVLYSETGRDPVLDYFGDSSSVRNMSSA
jgi:hypothetical protein